MVNALQACALLSGIVQDETLAANPMNCREHFRGPKSAFAGSISDRILGRSIPLWSFQPTGLPTRVYPVSLSHGVVSDTRSETQALISSIRGHRIRWVRRTVYIFLMSRCSGSIRA